MLSETKINNMEDTQMTTETQKVLHLTLKKKWFDMIASGEKKEEYREIKKYWVSRLVDGLDVSEEGKFGSFLWEGFWWTMQTPMAYDIVTFRNGYSRNAPKISFKVLDITDGHGKEKWGAEPGKEYFIIKLGQQVKEYLTMEENKK